MSFKMRAYIRRGVGILLAGVALVFSIFTLFQLAKDLSLWVLGRHTSAYVVDMWVERVGPEDVQELTFEYYVKYHFKTPKGVLITRTAQVGPMEWAGLGARATAFEHVDPSAEAPQGDSGVYQEQAVVPETTLGGVETGAPVSIVYFPLYPQHNRLDDSRFIPLLFLSYFPLFVLCAFSIGGAWYLLRPSPRSLVVPSIREIVSA